MIPFLQDELILQTMHDSSRGIQRSPMAALVFPQVPHAVDLQQTAPERPTQLMKKTSLTFYLHFSEHAAATAEEDEDRLDWRQ